MNGPRKLPPLGPLPKLELPSLPPPPPRNTLSPGQRKAVGGIAGAIVAVTGLVIAINSLLPGLRELVAETARKSPANEALEKRVEALELKVLLLEQRERDRVEPEAKRWQLVNAALCKDGFRVDPLACDSVEWFQRPLPAGSKETPPWRPAREWPVLPTVPTATPKAATQ